MRFNTEAFESDGSGEEGLCEWKCEEIDDG